MCDDMRSRFGKELIDEHITQEEFNSVIEALNTLKKISAKAESEVEKDASVFRESNKQSCKKA